VRTALLHYDVLGASSAAPLIVLVGGPHGIWNTSELARLSERHQVAVLHLRRVGRSSATPIGDRGRGGARPRHSTLAIPYAAQFPDHLAALLLITPRRHTWPSSCVLAGPWWVAAIVLIARLGRGIVRGGSIMTSGGSGRL
jgi:hypothetical protein